MKPGRYEEKFLTTLKIKEVISSDMWPEHADVAYGYGNTPDNENSVLSGLAELYHGKYFDEVYLCGGGPYRNPSDAPVAYNGFDDWEAKLIARGVPGKKIFSLPRPKVSHTGTEANNFALLAKERGWTSGFVVAPPFHMLRAFVNTVTFILKHNVNMQVYAAPGPADPWYERALYSQGRMSGLRIDLVEGEWKRLNDWYGNELDLVGPEEVLQYLAWRDGAAKSMYLKAA